MGEKEREYLDMLNLYSNMEYFDDEMILLMVDKYPQYFKLVDYEGNEDYDSEVKFIGKCPFDI